MVVALLRRDAGAVRRTCDRAERGAVAVQHTGYVRAQSDRAEFLLAVEARAARLAHPAERLRRADRAAPARAHDLRLLAHRAPAHVLRVRVPQRRTLLQFVLLEQPLRLVVLDAPPAEDDVLAPGGVGPPRGDELCRGHPALAAAEHRIAFGRGGGGAGELPPLRRVVGQEPRAAPLIRGGRGERERRDDLLRVRVDQFRFVLEHGAPCG